MPYLKFSLLFLLFAFISCVPSKRLHRILPKQLEQSTVFSNAFTGFALYDPESGVFIHESNSDKYFTPASNTKILTFFTAQQILGNLTAALRYEIRGDSLFFWGTGDPTFLNPLLEENNLAFEFLGSRTEQLFFCTDNFQDGRFGEGWMWDDFPYSFQPEKSPFPIYGNLLTFIGDTINGGFNAHPKLIEKYGSLDENMANEYPRIRRNEYDNHFRYNENAAKTTDSFIRDRPFRMSPEFFIELLEDTLKKPVNILTTNSLPISKTKELEGHSTFPLYRDLMTDSDNFIAEQLLLMCSDKIFGNMNTKQVIQYAKDSLMQGIPDEPLWVDGSGISRYNLFTPRSLVWLLEKMYREIPKEELFRVFPTGGISGTIENWYVANEPFVYAKTGTLRNNFCLSGYLKTKKGKILIFSFMNNHFKGGYMPFVKAEEQILKVIYENY